MVINAVLGLIAFEWAWNKLIRFRKPIPALEKAMPAFRRHDARKWRKWTFYPGAMTLLFPRFFAAIFVGLFVCGFLRIFMACSDSTKPLSDCRKRPIRFFYQLSAFCFQFFANFTFVTFKYLSRADVNHYEEWLGPVDE